MGEISDGVKVVRNTRTKLAYVLQEGDEVCDELPTNCEVTTLNAHEQVIYNTYVQQTQAQAWDWIK